MKNRAAFIQTFLGFMALANMAAFAVFAILKSEIAATVSGVSASVYAAALLVTCCIDNERR